MPKTPEAVIFDIGNVLINWDPRLLYDQLLPDRAAQDALFAAAGLDAMNEAMDLGAPFRETVYATAGRNPEYRDLIRAWHDRWIEMARPAIAGSWALLRALRARGVPVFALSNFGKESFALAETHYPELAEFDRRFLSGHLGVIKPDPAIYRIVEEETGFRGPQLFFIDDRADNVAAACARGWRGHRFTGAPALAEEIAALGLLGDGQVGTEAL
ncbi:MAG: HAD family hydrolase [Paracoccaceae bacterium]